MSADRELDGLRASVREWVEANFPASLRDAREQERFFQSMPMYPTGADWDLWKARLIEKRWTAPGWPAEFGGGGYGPSASGAIAMALVQAGAFNPVAGNGTTMLGPTLLEFGTRDQQERHLPPIVRGEIVWCQGFSEPNAGSDLASLSTRAVEDGGDFIVSGQKMWTSDAHHAHWCFCLVRTDPSRKHAGISFLLIDMASPGIAVRPIRTIAGNSHFCEVFFNDVRVSKENLVGKLGDGWMIAKRLLQFERDPTLRPRRQFVGDARPLDQIARDYIGCSEDGRLADAALRDRIARNMIDAEALRLLQTRMTGDGATGAGATDAISVAKNARAAIQQEREELLLEIMGYRGLGEAGAEFDDVELETTRAFLWNKAMTIFSGSTEIQNNIIAKRILHLPTA
ncbi:MAG: acyl-CoA dehydrogenase family protein [Acidisphaera sp.]|nr:acyl-CoA dehydrogenase family protein [Acidisphaera sp.]